MFPSVPSVFSVHSVPLLRKYGTNEETIVTVAPVTQLGLGHDACLFVGISAGEIQRVSLLVPSVNERACPIQACPPVGRVRAITLITCWQENAFAFRTRTSHSYTTPLVGPFSCFYPSEITICNQFIHFLLRRHSPISTPLSMGCIVFWIKLSFVIDSTMNILGNVLCKICT